MVQSHPLICMNWDSIKSILKLSIPLIISQLGLFFVQLSDTVMVGQIGSRDLAAISFGGNVYFFIYIFGIGIVSGLVPIIGEVYSKFHLSRTLLHNAIVLFTILGFIFMGFQISLIPFFEYLGQPKDVINIAIRYYIYLSISTVPLIIFCIFRYFLEGIGNTRAVMVIVISSNVINILLNYLLIYGRCGFPEMRAEGAGLATLISRILMVIIILIYFSGGVLRKYIKGFSIYSISKEYITRILKIGFPIALQMTMEGSTFAISGIIIGVFGEKVLAANQIAIIIGNLSFLLISAISSATTIIISQTKGLKDFQKTIEMTTNSYIVIVCINIITIIVLYLCRKYIVSFFTTDIEVETIAAQFVIYVCVYQLSDGIQGISMGVLRGFQDVKIIPVISLIVYFVISIPIGCVFAFVMSCGYNGLWYGYIIGLTLAAIYFYIRVKRDIRQIAYY